MMVTSYMISVHSTVELVGCVFHVMLRSHNPQDLLWVLKKILKNQENDAIWLIEEVIIPSVLFSSKKSLWK